MFSAKTVLITGGATGIGLAMTRKFAESGANVVMVSPDPKVGKKVEKELRSQDLEVTFLSGNAADEHQVKSFVTSAVDIYNQVDILINNAAVSDSMPFLDKKSDHWRKVFDITVNGTYFCTRVTADQMIEKNIKGVIINISSINSYRALRDSSHYNAGKGAMDQLTRCTALELADHGIRVNAINPGFINSGLSIVDGENELETEWFQSMYVDQQKIVLRRPGQPEEVANVALFLASEDSSYICGATIPVDGGLSITF